MQPPRVVFFGVFSLKQGIDVIQPRPQGFSLKNPFFKGKALGKRLDVIIFCSYQGIEFINFCLNQGIDFIIFCLNQGIDFIIFCLKQGIFSWTINSLSDSVDQAVNSFVIAHGLNKKEFRYLILPYTGYVFGLNVLNRVGKSAIFVSDSVRV